MLFVFRLLKFKLTQCKLVCNLFEVYLCDKSWICIANDVGSDEFTRINSSFEFRFVMIKFRKLLTFDQIRLNLISNLTILSQFWNISIGLKMTFFIKMTIIEPRWSEAKPISKYFTKFRSKLIVECMWSNSNLDNKLKLELEFRIWCFLSNF